MAKNSLIQLYQFKDFDMDKFVRRYLYKVSEQQEIVNPMRRRRDEEYIYKTIKGHAGVKVRDRIIQKCQYLQDVIIRMAYVKCDDTSFSLNARILENVIGKEYKVMLDVLKDMKYIVHGDGFEGVEHHFFYEEGKYSTLYTMQDVDCYLTKPFFNRKIIDYQQKALKETKKLREKYIDDVIIEKYGKDFYNKYLNSLRYINIKDEKGLMAFIENRASKSPNAAGYYQHLLEGLKTKDKRITNIDDSNRIYHILTNSKHEIKDRYLSIDFLLDCKNSHPILFNYFILNSHGIDISTSYQIALTLKQLHISTSTSSIPHNIPFYKRRKNLCKLLRDSDMENKGFARLSDDEIEYIYKTTNGILWDELADWVMKHPDIVDKWKELIEISKTGRKRLRYPELSTTKGDEYRGAVRDALKKEMFRQTFYATTYKMYDDYDVGKQFKKRFPKVYALIASWKKKKNKEQVIDYMKTHKLPTDKGNKSLSIAMMGLESEIFTAILKRLYAKRWNAVHIHDCIVIPQDGNVNHPTKQQIQDIMLDVYKSFGLCPTFD